MNKPPHRRWRWLTRLGVTVCLIITLAWLVSLKRTVGYTLSPGTAKGFTWAGLQAGCLQYGHSVPFIPTDLPSGLWVKPAQAQHRWLPRYRWEPLDQPKNEYVCDVIIPLWIPLFIAVAFTAFAWRRAARRGAHVGPDIQSLSSHQ